MTYNPEAGNEYNDASLEFEVDIQLTAWQFNYAESQGGSYSFNNSHSTSSQSSTSSASSSASSSSNDNSSSTPPNPVIQPTPATGIFSYNQSSYEDKTQILGSLEKYAQDNYLTGIPLYDNGGLVMYSDRINLPSDIFIPNYGFGDSQAIILNPMTAEQEPELSYRNYYHTWVSSKPETLNFFNSNLANVSDFYKLFSASYYSTRLNNNNDNYEWFNELATSRPIPLNANAEGFATQWKIPIRVDEDLVYSTLSKDSLIATFNGRQVAKEDYLTPIKLMLNYRWTRSNQLASYTTGFVGVQSYLDAIENGLTPDFNTVGIKLSVNENAIEFTFNQPQNSFSVIDTFNSSLYSPIPEAFIEAIGGPFAYGQTSRAVDTVLSLGVYTLEDWQDNHQYVFRKNPQSIKADFYHFEGIKYNQYVDVNNAFNNFLEGKIDVSNVPSSLVDIYKLDPRVRKTIGSAVFKLNLNATSQTRWEELFGVNGSIRQTPYQNYWDVKPIMSNKNFLDGLYFSINRQELAIATGRNPSQTFLSDAYMADPENAISYRSTGPAKAAYSDRSPETLGYNPNLAKHLFKAAGDELVASGKYVRGTVANPTTIMLDVFHQTEMRMNNEKPYYADYIEDTFNEANVGLKLVLDHRFNGADPFAPYDAMAVGQFDIAMGTISGSTLNPLSFMEILTSDNRIGFTLSWTEVDTAKLAQELVFDNKQWSFNALFEASQGTKVVYNGESVTFFDITSILVSNKTATTFDMTASGKIFSSLPDLVQVDILEAGIQIHNGFGSTEYIFYPANLTNDLVVDPIMGTWTLTLSGVPISSGQAFYMDIYYQVNMSGFSQSNQTLNKYKQFSLDL
jgi:ABC-type oligopeptide transport system substrate-binding subunit